SFERRTIPKRRFSPSWRRRTWPARRAPGGMSTSYGCAESRAAAARARLQTCGSIALLAALAARTREVARRVCSTALFARATRARRVARRACSAALNAASVRAAPLAVAPCYAGFVAAIHDLIAAVSRHVGRHLDASRAD